jgi:hypothetical protein
MSELNSPEIFMLRGYLEALCRCTTAANHLTYFEVKSYNLDGSQIEVTKVIKNAYPESMPEHGSIHALQLNEAVKRINKRLSPPELAMSFSNESVQKTDRAIEDYREDVETALIKGFWNMLRACIDYEQADVFGYAPSVNPDVPDELRSGVWWDFTYVILNKQQERCVIFHGGACD